MRQYVRVLSANSCRNGTPMVSVWHPKRTCFPTGIAATFRRAECFTSSSRKKEFGARDLHVIGIRRTSMWNCGRGRSPGCFSHFSRYRSFGAAGSSLLLRIGNFRDCAGIHGRHGRSVAFSCRQFVNSVTAFNGVKDIPVMETREGRRLRRVERTTSYWISIASRREPTRRRR